MQKLIISFLSCFFMVVFNAVAVDEISSQPSNDTQCATTVFANALVATSNLVSEYDDESVIQKWIYDVFSQPSVLSAVLQCPEVASIADDESIRFMPIQYNFPGGRQVIVNYETQPKILKQRITLASKRSVEELNDPTPKIGALNDTAIWTNTDPAWYGIMVVQRGAFDEYVGPDKNNTISLKYINDNIGEFYPSGATCTSKSALANDNDIINLAMHETVGVEKDTNDYYVAGDVNLQWISYAEIALDVIITVATFGGGAVVTGATKATRAAKTLKNLSKTIRELQKLDKVKDYMMHASKLARLEKKLGRIKDYRRLQQELSKIDKVRDFKKYQEKAKELEHVANRMKEIDKIADASKYTDNELKAMEKTVSEMQKKSKELIKADKNVAKYVEATEKYKEIEKYAQAYRTLRNKKAGNVAVRAWRAFKATTKGNKAINRGAKIARSSMKSGRVRDWLFQSTLKNIGTLGRMESAGGLLYGILKFAGDMYDWTESSTGEFTNGIEFKPLLLLSADDLEGQENVVNYGMWLMWAGDATDAADDDAAFLQAFDFADKFHMDLIQTMEDRNNYACDVDIYVVRPVLRNPGSDNPELYYLIMNDEPWTTAHSTSYFDRSAFSNLSSQEQNELQNMAYRAELEYLAQPDSEKDIESDDHTNINTDGLPSTKSQISLYSSGGQPFGPKNSMERKIRDWIAKPYKPDERKQPSQNITDWLGSSQQEQISDFPETGENIPATKPVKESGWGGDLYMTHALTQENVSKYNLKPYNGGCTPPETSNHWKNEILTSGQYENSKPAFEKFMITAFRKEGGCVNDPHDRGGYTCYGCASNGLCRGVNFDTITRANVEDLAYKKIYQKYGLDKLPDAFRGYALWGMWGSGAVTGIKQFQSTLGVDLTGKIDAKTIDAAENYTDDFADAYVKNRKQFFHNIVAKDPKQKKFLKGWLNGLNLLQNSGCHVVPTTEPLSR